MSALAARLLLALALVLNAAVAPWAPLLGGGAMHALAAGNAAHEHHHEGMDHRDMHHGDMDLGRLAMPCCDGADCHCGCMMVVSGLVASVAMALPRERAFFVDLFRAPAAPPPPMFEALRPPIDAVFG